MRSDARGDNYLDEEIKTVSARQMEIFEVPFESVGPMLSSKAITRKLSSVPFAKLNSLKSWMGQNVNSPFSNICAVTFKLYSRSSRTAAANRLTFSSRPLANSP